MQKKSCANNKLHAIYRTVGTSRHRKLISRREAVIISRLKTGHFRFTHSYLPSADMHVLWRSTYLLLDCPNFQGFRHKYFTASSLKEIFESVDNHNIIYFRKLYPFLSLTVVFVIHVLL